MPPPSPSPARAPRIGPTALLVAVLAVGLAGLAVGQRSTGAPGLVVPAVIVGATILLWATRALPEWLVSILFFTVCALGAIAPAPVLLSGFVGPAVWMIISGAIIGAAVRHTGLADRLGARLAALAQGPFPKVLGVVGLFSTGLAFIMPSGMGRIFLLIPLLEAFADRAGLAAGSRGRTAVMLAGVFGTFFPAMAILPANVPNNVLAGLLETTGIGVPSFSSYLLLHFPVLGIVKLAVIVAVLAVGYRDVLPVSVGEVPKATPWSRLEKRGAVVFAATVGLWLTDGWHGLPTTWVGMAAAVVCLWPGAGLMPAQPLRAVGLEPVIYVAGVVGLGAVVEHTGLATLLGEAIRELVEPLAGGPVRTFLLLGAIAAGVGLVVTVVGMPAILTPIAPVIAAATGLSLHAVTMSQALGYSTVFLPYQAPPLAVSVQIGAIPFRETARYCLVLSVLSMALIWPLDALWWLLLGVLP